MIHSSQLRWDTTPYNVDKTKHLIIKEIALFFEFAFQLFGFNPMKIKIGESYMVFSGNDVVNVNINNNTVTSESKNELQRFRLGTLF